MRTSRRLKRAAGLVFLVAVARLSFDPNQCSRAAEPAPARSALTPSQSLGAIHIDSGLRVELVAAEPQVQSPVALAFDEDGKLWVVEMLDYPNGPPPGKPPEGRIKVLEDRDGDGRFEHASVFAEGLLFANGLLPWKGGVIVTAAPYVLALHDENGDGKADGREVLYEGFAAANPQLRVSHPILGLDGWVYVANGLLGGKVHRAGKANPEVIDLSGRDFRFDLVHDRAEPIAGAGQFGNTFDNWGHRFVCTNRNHLIAIILEDRYARRNPNLAVPGPTTDDQNLGGAARTYPISRNWTTSSLHAGTFSASCGVTVYRGDLLPESYRGCAFTCDPTGNLVHQEILKPEGASFSHRPAREGIEFLASSDDSFRPVALEIGPDGALYVIDMDRAVIEHPDFMPEELKNRADLTVGKDRGRIWRIVPEGSRQPTPRPHLSRSSTADLVALLGHPNAWWRTTAQRLLLERQDPAASGLLRDLVATSDRPLARLHAAWLLEGASALEDELVLKLLRNGYSRIRENAVLIAERRLARSGPLRDLVLGMATDDDARVRFQVALSLGEWDDDRVLGPLAMIALSGVEDRWTRLAVETAVPTRAGALTATLLRPPHALASRPEPGRVALLRELATLVGSRRDTSEVASLLEMLEAIEAPDADRWRLAALLGLADGLGRRGTSLGATLVVQTGSGGVSAKANALLLRAVAVAEDLNRDVATRLDATGLLSHVPWQVAEPPLVRLLTSDPVPEVRLEAVKALAAQTAPEVAARLLASWKSYTPSVRREVTQALLARPERIASLLDELQAGRIVPADIDAVQARRLIDDGRPEIRDRARKLLQASVPEGRKTVLERYRPALGLEGDALRGSTVFRRNCAACHRVADIGVAVGPDIGDTRTKTKEMLLADILDPNSAIDANYVYYTVATKDGRAIGGVIASETSAGLTLRRAEGQSDVLLRQDIEEVRSTGVSLMPEGLEKDIPVAPMADLLAFLKGWRYLGDAVPPGPRMGR